MWKAMGPRQTATIGADRRPRNPMGLAGLSGWTHVGVHSTGRPVTDTARQPRLQRIADPAPGALRTVFRIFDAWGLSPDDARRLLGDLPASTYFKWRKGEIGRVHRDVLERASYVLGIYKALHLIFADPAIADSWLHRPNDAPGFGGRSAMERLRPGYVRDLAFVREYLDAQRGGWP